MTSSWRWISGRTLRRIVQTCRSTRASSGAGRRPARGAGVQSFTLRRWCRKTTSVHSGNLSNFELHSD